MTWSTVGKQHGSAHLEDPDGRTDFIVYWHKRVRADVVQEVRTGYDRIGEDKVGQGRTGQVRSGQGRSGQNRSGHDKVG